MERLRVDHIQTRQLGPVSLTLAASGCAIVSGASGSGKTLLLRAIADLDRHRGTVYLDGVACEHFRPTEWRRQVAYLPAETAWWSDRVGDHFQEVPHDSLKAVGFAPEVMDWDVTRLSSGEKQRLGLLRLLVNQPKVLLLDEPTASLDPDSVGKVEDLLDAYRETRGAAVMWVSHDPMQIQRIRGDHYRLEAGQLYREGRP